MGSRQQNADLHRYNCKYKDQTDGCSGLRMARWKSRLPVTQLNAIDENDMFDSIQPKPRALI